MSLSRAQRAGGAVLIGALSVLTIIVIVSSGSVRSRGAESEGFLGLVVSRIPDEEVSRLIDFLKNNENIELEGSTAYVATVHPSILMGFSGSGVHSLSMTGVIDRNGEAASTPEKTKRTASFDTTQNALSGEDVVYTLGANGRVHTLSTNADTYIQRETLEIEEAPASLELIALRASYLREYQATRLHRSPGFPGPSAVRDALQTISALPKLRVVENGNQTVSLLASGESLLLSGTYDLRSKKLVFSVEDTIHDLLITVDETHIPGTYNVHVERNTTDTELFSGLVRITPKRSSMEVTIEGSIHTRFTQSLHVTQTLELRKGSAFSVDAPELSLELGVVFGEK